MIKTMKFILKLTIISLLVISCRERTVKEIIDGGSYRYWQREWTEGYDEVNYFDDEGKWTIFEGYRNEPFTQYVKLEEYDGGDDLLDKKWDVINDSTIIYDGYKRKVSKVNDTILVLHFIDKRDSVYQKADTLHAVPIERIPKKFRKKYDFNYVKRNIIIG